MESLPRSLDEKRVSEITGRALPTLRNDRHNRRGIPYIKCGRQVKYSLTDVIEFMESRKKRTLVVSITTLFMQMFLMVLMLSFLAWPVLIATYIAFLVSSLMNGIIYHKTEKLGALLLNSFIIMGIFYGATISFLINLILIVS